MSLAGLNRLVAEAVVLGGGKHQCVDLGHDWRSDGGRQCSYASEMAEPHCSQTVYVCRACGLEDYGERGGPAYRECVIDGPCTPACSEAREIMLWSILLGANP